MSRLEALKKDLLEMSSEEIREKIKQIRADRIINKRPVKAARVKSNNAKEKLATLMQGMTPEQLEELFKSME